jgi:hypothetical protein
VIHDPNMVCRMAHNFVAPRSSVFTASAVALISGVAGMTYPAHYLHFPKVWAGLVLVAGTIGMIAALTVRPLLIYASGALLIAAATARSAATFVESQVTHVAPAPAGAAYLIASVQWAGYAYFVWVIWVRVVVPWAIFRGNPDES